MAAIDWPASLPAPLYGTLKGNPRDPYLKDPAQAGPPRRRKFTTRVLWLWRFSLRLTYEETALLKTFVETTTDGGVEYFNWIHPVTGASHVVAFETNPDFSNLTLGVDDIEVALEEI